MLGSVTISLMRYGYNDGDRVTSAVKRLPGEEFLAGWQQAFEFDNLGNRHVACEGGDAAGASRRETVYTLNSLNQYSSITRPGAFDVLGRAPSDVTVTVNEQPVTRQGEFWRREMGDLSNALAAGSGVRERKPSPVLLKLIVKFHGNCIHQAENPPLNPSSDCYHPPATDHPPGKREPAARRAERDLIPAACRRGVSFLNGSENESKGDRKGQAVHEDKKVAESGVPFHGDLAAETDGDACLRTSHGFGRERSDPENRPLEF